MKHVKLLLLMYISIAGIGYSQWTADYSNNGSGSITGWSINSTDKYIVNNYIMSPNSINEILCVNGSYASLLRYAQTLAGWNWISHYSNGGTGTIAGWVLRSEDKFTAMGHESYFGRTLVVNPNNGWATVLRYSTSGYFVSDWGNGGNNAMNGWSIRTDDKYVSGNFVASSSPEHEILFISPTSGHVATQRFMSVGWSALNWTTNGKIGSDWNIGAGDRYCAGDFDNDGIDELLCVAANGWAALLKYNGTAWQSIWSNGGNLYIGGYHIGSDDIYLRGKVTEGNTTQLMIINRTNDVSYLLSYSAGTWSTITTTSGWIGAWNIAAGDQYAMLGMGSHHKLFTSNSNGWSNLMQYNVAPPAPQNHSISTHYSAGAYYPKLNWDQHTHWDVNENSQGIQVWRRIFNGVKWSTYSHIGTVSGTTTQYIDYGTTGAGIGPKIAEYKLRATDLSGLVSEFSATQNINFGMGIEKGIIGTEASPKKYIIGANYPNPFNPTTTISYGLPVRSNVVITIFNSLGQQVLQQTMLEQSEGFHRFTFDARNLASGVYYYQFLATPLDVSEDMSLSSVKETRRMFLLK